MYMYLALCNMKRRTGVLLLSSRWDTNLLQATQVFLTVHQSVHPFIYLIEAFQEKNVMAKNETQWVKPLRQTAQP